jgi:hypothetical protein
VIELLRDRKRLWVLLLSIAAIVALVFLSAGLSGLELMPGRPLPRDEDAAALARLFFPDLPGSEILGFIFVGLYFFAVLLLPFAIVYFIVSPQARRWVLRSLGLLMWILAIYLVFRARPELFQQITRNAETAWAPEELVIPSVEFAANPSPWVVLLTTVGLALSIAGGLVAGAWYVWRQSRPPQSTLQQLAHEAQEALDALQAGADVQDAVMRCYFDMNRVLGEQRGIRRGETMTPREFELHLVEVGLPHTHVQQLTRLFESVRYGTRVTGEQEERQAVACLSAIVQACTGST